MNQRRAKYTNGLLDTAGSTSLRHGETHRSKIRTRSKNLGGVTVKKLAKKFAPAVQITKATYNFSVVYLFKSTNSTDKD
jgi:hypothetical protein